jgi:hypothetical protein
MPEPKPHERPKKAPEWTRRTKMLRLMAEKASHKESGDVIEALRALGHTDPKNPATERELTKLAFSFVLTEYPDRDIEEKTNLAERIIVNLRNMMVKRQKK